MEIDTSIMFQNVEMEVAKYNAQGKVFLLGNFNSYTNTINDFVEYDSTDNDNFFHMPLDYQEDASSPRENMDARAPNDSGKMLLQLCMAASLRIVNGRVNGDKNGSFTRYPLHGGLSAEPSTIDYCLADASCLPQI